MWEKAIKLLQNPTDVNGAYCKIEGIRVAIEEKDLLLQQLLAGEDYLKVPMSLFFGSMFFRELKVKSNIICHQKKNK